MARRKQVEKAPPPPKPPDADDVRDRFPRGCWTCGVLIGRRESHCPEHQKASLAPRRGSQKARTR